MWGDVCKDLTSKEQANEGEGQKRHTGGTYESFRLKRDVEVSFTYVMLDSSSIDSAQI